MIKTGSNLFSKYLGMYAASRHADGKTNDRVGEMDQHLQQQPDVAGYMSKAPLFECTPYSKISSSSSAPRIPPSLAQKLSMSGASFMADELGGCNAHHI